jgi:hypothetical protein
VAVSVLVFEAIRKWVSPRGGIVEPSVVGAVGDRELALGSGQDDQCTGNQQLLGCRVHDGLERGLLYRVERRRAFVVPSRPATISARSFSLRDGSFC